MRPGHCQAKSIVIGSHVKLYYEDVKRIHKPKDIINDVRKEFGVNISYSKAWRLWEKALDMIWRGAEESFQLLPSYLYMLKLKNPRTIVEIESDSESRFKYLFMAIGACLARFRSQMRPIIVVDACFLKGKYLGSLFVVTYKDDNNNVYPIAWGVGDSENDVSWEWHKSISKAVLIVFPNALNVHCIYHIGQNVKAKFQHENAHALFYKATKAYRESEFHELFNELERYDPAVETYLREAGFSCWAHAYSDGKRFDIMMTNIAECHNAALANAWSASKMGGHLTSWAEGEIAKRFALCQYWQSEPIDMYKFNVKDGNSSGIVDLKAKTCTCQVFDFKKLPCGHALAVARSRNIDSYTLSFAYYQTKALLCAYADPIMPIGLSAILASKSLTSNTTNP
ncbi:uncharacterized protein LOC127811190 [Diospyros lotus]|uniref:uncharacterized protein LOC127811190 n=1 Tax=Diospyros lotus TaxID=55363 RepID=UPI0022599721|nr:uncharacterized protein LOC127811190 [Diospyros lotus]